MTAMTPGELFSLLLECSAATSNSPTSINPACPALAPPQGQLPLDPDAPSLWKESLGVLVACCVLVAASMALRVFTRMWIVKRPFAWEDGKAALQSCTHVDGSG